MNPEASNSLMEEREKKKIWFSATNIQKKCKGVNKGEKVNVSCNSSFILQNKVGRFSFVEKPQDHTENK